MKKEIALIATAVITVAALAVGSTLAFFTDKGEVTNVVTTGNVAITLTEPQFDQSTKGSRSVEIMPGDIITKDPTVTNSGSNAAYVRCKVEIENGPSLSGQASAGLNSDEQKQLLQSLNIDNGSWVLSNDGYYYYQQILPAASGQTSSVKLFDTVQIPSSWGSPAYPIDNAKFRIVISAEGIQAEYFKPARENGKIVGWNYSDGPPVSMESSTP